MSWLELGATILTAVIAGGGSGLLTPWFAWRIERQKESRAHRRQLVKEWREQLLDKKILLAANPPGPVVESGFGAFSNQRYAQCLVCMPAYSTLESHLTEKFRNTINGLLRANAMVMEMDGGMNPRPSILDELSAEIARIEKLWGLQ